MYFILAVFGILIVAFIQLMTRCFCNSKNPSITGGVDEGNAFELLLTSPEERKAEALANINKNRNSDLTYYQSKKIGIENEFINDREHSIAIGKSYYDDLKHESYYSDDIRKNIISINKCFRASNEKYFSPVLLFYRQKMDYTQVIPQIFTSEDEHLFISEPNPSMTGSVNINHSFLKEAENSESKETNFLNDTAQKWEQFDSYSPKTAKAKTLFNNSQKEYILYFQMIAKSLIYSLFVPFVALAQIGVDTEAVYLLNGEINIEDLNPDTPFIYDNEKNNPQKYVSKFATCETLMKESRFQILPLFAQYGLYVSFLIDRNFGLIVACKGSENENEWSLNFDPYGVATRRILQNKDYFINSLNFILEGLPAIKNIAFTGHSLGGAVAQQLANLFVANFSKFQRFQQIEHVHLVTFNAAGVTSFVRDASEYFLAKTNAYEKSPKIYHVCIRRYGDLVDRTGNMVFQNDYSNIASPENSNKNKPHFPWFLNRNLKTIYIRFKFISNTVPETIVNFVKFGITKPGLELIHATFTDIFSAIKSVTLHVAQSFGMYSLESHTKNFLEIDEEIVHYYILDSDSKTNMFSMFSKEANVPFIEILNDSYVGNVLKTNLSNVSFRQEVNSG